MADDPTPQKQAGAFNVPPFAAGMPILPEEKSLYFNGFALAVSGGDIVLTLLRNGVPIQTMNASFTVAKTFGESIMLAIKRLEEATSHQIMTVQDVATATAKLNTPHGTN